MAIQECGDPSSGRRRSTLPRDLVSYFHTHGTSGGGVGMGIQDREYYRESSGGFFDSWRWGATNWLIVITVIVFLAQAFTHDFSGGRDLDDSSVTAFGSYDPGKILKQGQAWRLVTSIFLHGGVIHLAFNMLILWWAGSRIEDLLGKREFVFFYLGSGIFANLIQLALHATGVMAPTQVLGASGAVMAVLVLYACHDPFQKVSILFLVTVPLWLCAVLYVAFDLFGALGMSLRGVAYVSHLGGALFGFTYYRTGFRFHHLIPSLPSRSRAAPKLRIVRPEPDELDDREPVTAGLETPSHQAESASEEPFERKVDRVLEKVSKHGQESLTPEEREILFRAGEVYKKRRK